MMLSRPAGARQVSTMARRAAILASEECDLVPTQAGLWADALPVHAALVATSEAAAGLDAFASVDWSFGDSLQRDLTHALHPWPAKFIPDIPGTVIRLLSKPGETI